MKLKLFVRFIALFLCSSFVLPNIALAHSGGTDENGCHRQSSTGLRHCHSSGSDDSGSSSSTAWIIGGAALGIITLFFLTRSNNNETKKSKKVNTGIGGGESFIDLELNSIASNYNPVFGEQITLTLSVFNNSYVTATNVEVSSIIPEGLKIISFQAEQGTYSASTGTWNIGNINDKTTKKLYINVLVESNDVDITSEVISANELDRDSTPNNNRSSEDDQSYLEINNSKLNLSKLELSDNTQLKISSVPDFNKKLEEFKQIGETKVYLDSLKVQKDEYYLELEYKF